jgi:hypothetical protein
MYYSNEVTLLMIDFMYARIECLNFAAGKSARLLTAATVRSLFIPGVGTEEK